MKGNIIVMEIKDLIIKAQKEYIEFLGEELNKNSMFLYAHNILTSDEVAMKGEMMRENIRRLEEKDNNLDNDVIEVTKRLYYEANPNTKMDVPSFAFEQIEKADKRRIESNSELSLYDWCKRESV